MLQAQVLGDHNKFNLNFIVSPCIFQFNNG